MGELKSNAFGLFDVIGNVWEWCQDWHGSWSGYSGAESEITVDPHGPNTGTTRIFRGGDWNATSVYCRSAFRDAGDSGVRDRPRRGFRVALSVDAVRQALSNQGIH